jgi:DNA-directed RNA polymerase specialized sigma24 family protein
MRDASIVASVVDGDPAGLADAYDQYADRLYAYCQFLLDDPADAADAVEDTFLVAGARLGRLRDPGRLRPWLYAVARRQSWQLLKSRPGTKSRSAVRDQREVVELRFGQGLELAETALALGISRRRARSLLSRARERFGAISDAELGAVSSSPAGPVPPWLQDRLMWTVTSRDDEALSRQAEVRGRARVRAFRRNGFPRPVSRQARSAEGLALTAGGVALAIVAAVIIAMNLRLHPIPVAGPHVAARLPASVPAAQPTPSVSLFPTSFPSLRFSPSPTPSATATASRAPRVAAAKHPAAPKRAGIPTPSAASSATARPAPSTRPTVSTAPAPPPAAGTLAVSATSLPLSQATPSNTFTLTAENGPVAWSISQSGGGPALSVSPTSGTLPASQSVTVTVFSVPRRTPGFTTSLLVSSGGQTTTITVTYSRYGQ